MLFMEKNKKLTFLPQIVAKDVVDKVRNQVQNQTHALRVEEEEKLGLTKDFLQYSKLVPDVVVQASRFLTPVQNVKDLEKHKLKGKYLLLFLKVLMTEQELGYQVRVKRV